MTQTTELAGVESDLSALADTIYGEARGELYGGKMAVGCVVRNRVRKPGWWGRDYESVCKKPFQFSCWNDRDPNLAAIKSVPEHDDTYQECIKSAREILSGCVDVTLGSTHYHALKVKPTWAQDLTPIIQIGGHLFYRNVP